MTRRTSAILAIALSLGLVLGACGDDATPGAGDDDSGQGAGEGGDGFTVTIAGDSIELPDEVAGGVVEVTLESDAEEPEVNFTQVPTGTSEDDFRQAIASAVSGGAIPELMQENVGVTGGGQTVQLPEGNYYAWAEPDSPEGEEGEGEEGEGPDAELGATTTAPGGEESGEGGGPDQADPASFLVKPLTVTAGSEGELPDAGSTVTARDYTFDISVETGGDKFTFRNEGPDQVHHAVFMNFEDVAVEDVEENLVEFLQSEGEGEPPAAFRDLDMGKVFEVGHSGVFTPGLGGTADATFESGNTYAAVCFLPDRAGGPPHVFAHGMYKVFTVE